MKSGLHFQPAGWARKPALPQQCAALPPAGPASCPIINLLPFLCQYHAELTPIWDLLSLNLPLLYLYFGYFALPLPTFKSSYT